MGNFFEKNSCLEKKDSAADAEENRENARSCRQKVLYAAGLAGGLKFSLERNTKSPFGACTSLCAANA